jgi:hypothetical protein
MRRVRAATVTALLACTLVVGATSVSTGSVEGTRSPACSLLRERDIEQVLAVPVTNTEPMQRPVGASLCTWTVDGSGGAGLVAVYVSTGDRAKGAFADARATFRGPNRERVRGLGKRAFYAVPVASVYFLRNRSLVYVQNLDGAGTSDPVGLRRQAVALAQLVSDRL